MSVHDTGNGWIVRWRMGSKQPSRKFKRADGFSREDAEAFDHAMKRRKRVGGIDPLASERDFSEVVEEWWRSHHATVSVRTRDNQRSYLENRILPRFEGFRLCDVTPPELEAFRVELVDAGTGDPTLRKILYVLSGVFTHAQRMGYVAANPVQPIKKPGGYRQRLIQPFPPDRVELLRSWFLQDEDVEGATMVSVLAYSGPRPAEAHLGLTIADIGERTILYRGSKNERDRSTRLLSPLAADLRGWQRESGVMIGQVFGWSHSKFNNWRRRRFHKAARECGVDVSRPYDLRHAFATLLAGEGRSVDYIARQLGHSVATCERWYRHLMDDVEHPIDAEERILTARAALGTVPSGFLDHKETSSL